MKTVRSAKISVSLPEEWLRYVEEYRERHGLTSRSEVLVLALRALREAELAEGYRQMARDYAQADEAWVDSGLEETLDLMDRG
ncbi:ribbon-helix-helix domain-containing protein [Oceanithermus desulfurans]|uniref:Metal-responsive CopG/Arc/MetJ family transcriptional regulator n=1 Tax=Oceanithermus desulfurans TaxID=227924 RepID=A0ABR6NZZ3_9DEIN|nr:ribbon-helix-helix domain-containing protein [Oceanithermus desulfurans]MBB6029316.1 metal-responsive CopG/Arc/MetJ family transcriptional regulator [Oceanithermus desulfurans]